MACSEPVVRIFKIIFMVLLLATGIAFIIVGAYVNSQEIDYINLTSSKLNQVAILFIVVGSLVVVVSLLGCFWVFKKVDYALYVYLILLGILCIMEFSGGIAAIVYHDDVADQVTTNLAVTASQYKIDGTDDTTQQWDNLQQHFDCCGTDDPSSWSQDTPFSGSNNLPKSCCASQKTCTTQSDDLYKEGCSGNVTDALEHNANILGGSGIGLAVLQLIGVLVTGIEVMIARCFKKICCCCCDGD